MASLTTTAFANALKILYSKGLEEVWYKKSPFLAWVNKSYNFEGASKQIVPLVAGIRGSTKFAEAMAAKSNPTLAKFLVTRVKDYVIGSIDNEAMKASRSQKGAMAQALKTQMDAALYEFGRSAAFQVWGDGTGTRGTVSSESTVTLTLTDVNDMVKFEIGMVVEAKSSGGTLRSGSVAITAIDRDAKTLTAAANWTTGIPGLVATDTIARAGDYTASSSNVLSGVLAWIPPTAPTTGDSFFGQDRSVDVNRLSGTRVLGAGKTIEEIVFDAQAEAAINGAQVDTLWLNSKRRAELCKSLQGKAMYQQTSVTSSGGQSGKVKVGFTGFVVPGEDGPVTIMSDPNCPYAYGLMTRKAAWELSCLDGCPHFADEAGGKFMQETSADAIEFRLKVYWQLCCENTRDNILISWDA
jgi:hypothetical protein